MWQRLAETPIITAIIGLIGAAIIVPLIKKFYFDVQNCLHVELRPWNYKVSEALKKTVMENLDPKLIWGGPMGGLIHAKGYMTVTITNIGKKKIAQVSVMAPDTDVDMVCQIDDADEIAQMKKGQAIVLGDIQPRHSRVIHIWTNVDTTDFDFVWFKKLLRISADELDAAPRLRFPVPRYLRMKYEPRLVVTVGLLAIAAFFASIYLGIIY